MEENDSRITYNSGGGNVFMGVDLSTYVFVGNIENRIT